MYIPATRSPAAISKLFPVAVTVPFIVHLYVSPAAFPTVNLLRSVLHVVAGEVIEGTIKGGFTTKVICVLSGSHITEPILAYASLFTIVVVTKPPKFLRVRVAKVEVLVEPGTSTQLEPSVEEYHL